ncbi:MAG: alpha/beta hydrolase [Solirubrobacterales bacterium]
MQQFLRLVSPRLVVLFATLGAITVSFPSAASGQLPPSGYCDPTAGALFDPVDVPPGGSDSAVGPDIRERTITVAGQETRLLESGARTKKVAVVLVHGIPGSAADWADLLPRFGNRRRRAVALDMPGYGHAADAWGLERTPDVGARFLNDAMRKLGIRRVHLVAHDIGGPVALEWASRKPRRLRSATLINTGLLLGYRDHSLASISRPPGTGELFWLGLNRSVFTAGLSSGQTVPLPQETTDRWYDDLDRETRCTILETYRSSSEEEVDAVAQAQAAALARRANRPALVIWGADDPYLPVAMAERQREGFPAARVEVFDDSGHWPFVDYVDRTAQLAVPFVRQAIRRDHRR